ncbi:hypothetical protein Tco_0577937 [Tanacetum coccineum]
MSDEWILSEVIPIYKNKGDAQVCRNYRGIKLHGHTMKFWERVIERRLRRETRVLGNQFGLMLGRTLIDKGTPMRYLRVVREGEDQRWVRWRAASRVLCDKKAPFKLKGRFYRVAIRPCILYGSECWTITKAQANKVEVVELRMLRWTCGKTILNMIPNGVSRIVLEVETIISKMRESRLRWFGHVRRMSQQGPVRRVEALIVNDKRRRGRPKLR